MLIPLIDVLSGVYLSMCVYDINMDKYGMYVDTYT